MCYMSEQHVHFDDIGEVSFVKNKRAKNLRITINRSRGIKVTIPKNVPINYAFHFVEQKKDWIRKSILKFELTTPQKTIFQPGYNFSTRFHNIDFTYNPDSPLKIKVSKGLIAVIYPSQEVLLSEAGQKLIGKGIEFAIRKEAKHYLPLRLEILAKKNGFSYKEIRVKNLKSRWGSCSSQNNINLNIHLMRLPEHLIDYVILHELAHTVHKNHGKLFWQLLDELSGDAKALTNEMKKYQTQIF
jgi:predicted metal-dependent hydrolase